MPLLNDWKLDNIKVEDILIAQGADPEVIRRRSPRVLEIAEKALELGLQLARPAVLIEKYQVINHSHQKLHLGNGAYLKGALVAEYLASAEEVFVCIGTIGNLLEERVTELMHDKFEEAFALDSFGSVAVDHLSILVCNYLEGEAREKGNMISSAIFPGHEGWPIQEGQSQLFALVNSREVGVELTTSMMMLPRKSTSFVIGCGKNISKNGEPCDLCNLRETCFYRKNRK